MWDNERWRITVPGFFAGLGTPFIVQEGILRQEEWSLSLVSFVLSVLCVAVLLIAGFGISTIVNPPKENDSSKETLEESTDQ